MFVRTYSAARDIIETPSLWAQHNMFIRRRFQTARQIRPDGYSTLDPVHRGLVADDDETGWSTLAPSA